ncbi:MAG: hypothetical protein AB7Y46_00170 [Armatimonadota bacterium]
MRAAPLLLALAIAAAPARQLRTHDGLAVTLDDASGQATAVTLGGRPLPVPQNPGGLFVQELRRADDLPSRDVLTPGFNGDQPAWTLALMAHRDALALFARRIEGDAAEGAGFLRIGNGQEGGAGMAAAEMAQVQPGEVLTISWRARAAATDGTFILCLRLFGEHGRDLTAAAVPPHDWQYTPYSNAHYKVGFPVSQPDRWQHFSHEYVVPPTVARVRVSLRVYQGGGLTADIDDLHITARPGGWGPERPVRGPLTGADAPAQAAQLDGLRIIIEYADHADHLSELSVLPDRNKLLASLALDPRRTEVLRIAPR